MPSRLSDRLLASGIVSAEGVRAAVARQAVYGGALDTALLELEALDETTLWEELVEATGLTMPARALCEAPEKIVNPDGSPALDLDGAWSARCRAVPVGIRDGTLQILCGEPVAGTEIAGRAGALGMPYALSVAPEIWIAAVQQAIYGRPMEPRLVRLFARIVGAEPVRRWQASHRPPPAPALPEPPIEIPPPPPPPRRVEEAAPLPATAPAAVRPDAIDVASLIEQLEAGDDIEAAQAALVAFALQDFGTKPKRWAAWWAAHEGEDRMGWLFEGLSHKAPEIRAAAEQELRARTGQYFGYAFDLPRREREAARARWQAWWAESGRRR
jgi:hypothetical protein